MKTFAALLFLTLGLMAADPGLVNLLPPESTILAGMDVQMAKTTPFGQYVLAMFANEDAKLARFIEATGFDPRRHLREVIFAGSRGQRSGLVALKGDFDATRLTATLALLGGKKEDYKGVAVMLGKSGNEAFAVLDATTAVGGTPAEVRAAIDRRSASSILAPALAVRVNHWSTSQHAWVVMDDVGAMAPRGDVHGPVNPQILTKVNQAAGGVRFGQVVQVTGEAEAVTETDASALADVVRMLAQLALVKNNDPDAAAIIRSLTVAAHGRNVQLSLSIPEEKLEQIVRPPQRRPARVRPVAQ